MTKLKSGPSFNGQSAPLPSRPPQRWISPEEKARLKAERAEAAKRRQERCDKLRYNAIVKKFGVEMAVQYGVPLEFVARIKVAAARAERRRQSQAGRNPK